MTYKAEELSAEESAAIIRRITGSCGPYDRQRKMVLSDGFELRGTFDVIARDSASGRIEWQHSQDNLVTDLGRQLFAFDAWSSVTIGFAPSTEPPSTGRCALATDSTQCVAFPTAGIGTITTATYTRTWSGLTSPAPGANRTLGTLWVQATPNAVSSNMGISNLVAYALLSPTKVQTTSQTIELNYRLSINPIV